MSGDSAQFQIGYMSDDCLEQAKMLLDGHLESLELLEEVRLYTYLLRCLLQGTEESFYLSFKTSTFAE